MKFIPVKDQRDHGKKALAPLSHMAQNIYGDVHRGFMKPFLIHFRKEGRSLCYFLLLLLFLLFFLPC